MARRQLGNRLVERSGLGEELRHGILDRLSIFGMASLGDVAHDRDEVRDRPEVIRDRLDLDLRPVFAARFAVVEELGSSRLSDRDGLEELVGGPHVGRGTVEAKFGNPTHNLLELITCDPRERLVDPVDPPSGIDEHHAIMRLAHDLRQFCRLDHAHLERLLGLASTGGLPTDQPEDHDQDSQVRRHPRHEPEQRSLPADRRDLDSPDQVRLFLGQQDVESGPDLIHQLETGFVPGHLHDGVETFVASDLDDPGQEVDLGGDHRPNLRQPGLLEGIVGGQLFESSQFPLDQRRGPREGTRG